MARNDASASARRQNLQVTAFGAGELRSLLAVEGVPVASIYIPRPEAAPDPERDRLRFRAAVERVRELLAGHPEVDAPDEWTQPVSSFATAADPWTRPPGTVAVFLAPGLRRAFWLPAQLPELAVVGPTAHTRPLLQHLQSPDGFRSFQPIAKPLV